MKHIKLSNTKTPIWQFCRVFPGPGEFNNGQKNKIGQLGQNIWWDSLPTYMTWTSHPAAWWFEELHVGLKSQQMQEVKE